MMRGRKQFLLTVALVLLVFGLGTRIVSAEERTDSENAAAAGNMETAENDERAGDEENAENTADGFLQEEVEEAMFSEIDFSEIEDSLTEMLPEAKTSFSDLVNVMISGETAELGQTFLNFAADQLFYEFNSSRHILAYILAVALTAAVFSNFAGALKSRQISEISFYVTYILLVTLCLNSFQTLSLGVEERLDSLMDFMRVLCPGFFMAVAFASGSTSALFFYNIILLLIYVAEAVVVRFVLPVINIYIMVRVLGCLTGEDFLTEFADLIRKAVTWTLRTLLACVVGVNIVQGLLAPAIDTLKRSALTRTAEALPWVGNVMGGAAELVLGTAVLIKNGIGMAGAAAAVAVCASPILQMAVMTFLYKLTAALVQPVSDKRITMCISGVSEGYELMMRSVFTTGVLFLLTIAVVASSTS